MVETAMYTPALLGEDYNLKSRGLPMPFTRNDVVSTAIRSSPATME